MSRQAFDPLALRSARGDTPIAVVAAAVGISVQTVRRWELGVTVPDANSLALLSQLFSRPIESWYAEVGARPLSREHRRVDGACTSGRR